MSEAERISALGLSLLSQSELDLSSLYPEGDLDDKKNTVLITAIIVLVVNVGVSGALLGVKAAMTALGKTAAPAPKATTLANIMDDGGNALPRPMPPPPPGAIAVNVAPPTAPPQPQAAVSLQDLGLDLDLFDDDIDL
jgi:hypothetical protein